MSAPLRTSAAVDPQDPAMLWGQVLAFNADVIAAALALSSPLNILVANALSLPTLEAVLDYYTDNLSYQDMPSLILSNAGKRASWKYLPMGAEETHQINLWGFVSHTDQIMRARWIRALADTTMNLINRQPVPLRAPGTNAVYYWTDMPLARIDFVDGKTVDSQPVQLFQGTIEVCRLVNYGSGFEPGTAGGAGDYAGGSPNPA